MRNPAYCPDLLPPYWKRLGHTQSADFQRQKYIGRPMATCPCRKTTIAAGMTMTMTIELRPDGT